LHAPQVAHRNDRQPPGQGDLFDGHRADPARTQKGVILFRCATCGAEAAGSPEPICGCGIVIAGLPRGRRSKTGFFCGPNPDRGPGSPSEFAVLFDRLPARVTYY
jgi:hypothetical protein